MISYEPVRGMKDYFGEYAERIEYIQEVFRKTVINSGYIEIISPILEEFELFALKGGEELRNSMYVFKDKAGRELALRPEFTPSVVRIFLNNLQHFPKPLRLYYIGTVYRYDEPQYGRYREFRQAGVEMIGEGSLASDIEVLHLLISFYKNLHLNNIVFKLNNIGIYRKLFEYLKIPDNTQEHILHLVDKGRTEEALEILSSYNQSLAATFRFLLGKKEWNEKMLNEFYRDYLEKLNIKDLDSEVQRLIDVFNIISKLNVKINLDLGFVRGLAYYTGIIFEAIVPNLPFSIAGGGRYDNLVELYGGPSTPAIGFAIGVERTLEAIKDLEFKSFNNNKKIVVIPLDYSVIDYSLSIIEKIRENNYICVLNTKNLSLSKLIPFYSEQGFQIAVIVGKKEKEEGSVTIRNLTNKTQETILVKDIVDRLRQII